MTIYTYCISHKDRVIYVGKTMALKKRINRHHHNFKSCKFPLYKYMRNKSVNVKRDFIFSILETNQTNLEAHFSERYWIKLYKPECNKQIPK
jgi:excinuclease UvrABC nuclease subunit